jgi:radical SAM protein with 4Fe4S-binding SPASM domain
VNSRNLLDLPAISEMLSGFPRMVLWDVFFLVPTGRGQMDDVTSAEEHEETYRWLHDLERSVPFGIKTTLGQPYRRVVLQAALHEGKGLKEAWAKVARSSTNDGKGVCFISHVGEVSPSGFLPIVCGNVRTRSVVDIYCSDPVFRALRDPGRLNGKCGRCHFQSVCGGSRARAYAYTGDYLGAEPCCVFDPDGAGNRDLGNAR